MSLPPLTCKALRYPKPAPEPEADPESTLTTPTAKTWPAPALTPPRHRLHETKTAKTWPAPISTKTARTWPAPTPAPTCLPLHNITAARARQHKHIISAARAWPVLQAEPPPLPPLALPCTKGRVRQTMRSFPVLQSPPPQGPRPPPQVPDVVLATVVGSPRGVGGVFWTCDEREVLCSVQYYGAPYAPGGHRGDVGDDGGRGTRRGVATPAAVVADGAATRGPGRGGGPADRLGPSGERTRPAAPGTQAQREAGLARPRGRWRAREGAAGDGRPGATRRVQRVARGTVSPPRL